ncbi:DUF742 domain-containing protein [Streptomyces sp. ISL-12]|uniref:DUF742 domain-containing protein n=1 Tax=Streptomyces sp. ISL-12 TaxID=2819177 RepID=UPI001BE70C93|nr:DUF742 domain-containing protein [Streptomyces sp. ISL-12]MBT2412063.1 DUF742 domain-containing protein [Streptomyces sp. ISL-12]
MSEHGASAQESAFVRTYTLTGGRTRPRHLLSLETVLEAGPGRPGPAQAEECRQIVAWCRDHRRSLAELAGLLGRPVTAAKILVSDLLDADALLVAVVDPYTSSGQGVRPSTQLLEALSASLRRKWPDAIAYPQAG